MSAYRYLVFPKGRQPTIGEAGELQNYAGDLAGRFAWGVDRNTGALALAFDGATFDHVRQINAGFQSLVHRWELSGCEVVEHLKFVKKADALAPTNTVHWHPQAEGNIQRSTPLQKIIAQKELAAKEAVGRSLLEMQQTIERQAWLIRAAGWLPYALMGLAALFIISMGFYTYHRLSSYEGERRQETIERVLEEEPEQVMTNDEIPNDERMSNAE